MPVCLSEFFVKYVGDRNAPVLKIDEVACSPLHLRVNINSLTVFWYSFKQYCGHFSLIIVDFFHQRSLFRRLVDLANRCNSLIE